MKSHEWNSYSYNRVAHILARHMENRTQYHHLRILTRITQVLGLILGVIVVGAPSWIVCPSSVRSWSGFDQSTMHRPSFSPDSRRNRTFPHISPIGSTWKLHSHRSMPYVGRRHRHADGQSSHGPHHWHTQR